MKGRVLTTSLPQGTNTSQADRDMVYCFLHSEEPEPCWWLAEEAIFVGVDVPCANVGQESWTVCRWVEWVEIHHYRVSDVNDCGENSFFKPVSGQGKNDGNSTSALGARLEACIAE